MQTIPNTLRCKCCNSKCRDLGAIDFNKTCHDRIAGRVFSISDILVPYFNCTNCGFIFTDYMDSWSAVEFERHIYNSEYSKADGILPGYESATRRETISYKNGLTIAKLLDGAQADIRLLDYGSGGDPGDSGLALIDKGFDLASYEPYFSKTVQPKGKYDFIYLIEVIEHCHNVLEVAEYLSRLLQRDGMIHIQTLLHPYPTPAEVLKSWYIAPRNGHISIFTYQALAVLFRRFGINIVNTLHGIFGFREKPRYKNLVFV